MLKLYLREGGGESETISALITAVLMEISPPITAPRALIPTAFKVSMRKLICWVKPPALHLPPERSDQGDWAPVCVQITGRSDEPDH